MIYRNHESNSSKDLRKRAEEFLVKKSSAVEIIKPGDVMDLVEDLRIHQVELEMQNQELRRAYEELEESKTLYSDLYDFAPVGYATLDENNLISRINLAGSELLGIERRRLLKMRFSRFITADYADRFYQHRKRCFETRERQTCDLKLKRFDNSILHVRMESIAAPDDQGDLNRIRTAIIDITGIKMADERIMALSRDLLWAQENERKMISMELHDRIAQDLSAAKMEVDAILCEPAAISPELKNRLSEVSGIIRRAVSAVRDLSYDLRPPTFERTGIASAVRGYSEEFSEKTGIVVEFSSVGMEGIELDDLTRINLWRLLQEGLNNMRKHAEASNARISLSYAYPNIILRIMDDGKGFDMGERNASMIPGKRMGLRSMEERVRLLRGAMEISSRPGLGTKILIRLPYGKETDG